MTRFWSEGLPLTVTCDRLATPEAFVWSGHRHRVTQVVERWRVEDGWWQRRIWREYFTLTTDTGLLVEIYHDVRAATWRLQRLYD
jgi:hypothetical protein